jgi:hypothetical protein
MIDTTQEELLSMSQAAKVCPKIDGKRPHAGSIWRWASKGVHGVQLEHVRVGRRVCTSREALNRFFNELAQATPPTREKSPRSDKPKGRTVSEREKAIAAARKRLEKRGVIQETEH